MTATPTPEEARRALQDIDDRQRQTVAAGASPHWWWIVGGVLVAGYGVLVDLRPGIVQPWGEVGVWLLLFVVIARNSRWGAAFFGRRVRPRLALGRTERFGFVAVGLLVLIVLNLGATWLDVPHVSAGFGIAGGLLIALAGPWWEHRVLKRNARQ